MKFLIIDDHILYLEGIRTIISQQFPSAEIVTCNAINKMADIFEQHLDFDLILLDLRLPGGGAPKALDNLRQEKRIIPVLIVSASESSTDIQLIMDLGAAGYLPKTSPPDELLLAINTVLSGNIYLPEKWRTRLADKNSSIIIDDGGREIVLSPRLHDVIQLIEKGYSTKGMSQILSLSEHTIYGYVKDLFSKFEVRSRAELIQVAKQFNIFDSK